MSFVKGVGPDGVLRAASFLKGVDPGGVLRTASFLKVVGPDGVLRTVFLAGGAPPDGENNTIITPASKYLEGRAASRSFVFTASTSSGAITAYSWGVLTGPGTVTSGGTIATATLTVAAAAGESEFAEFFCDMTIDGDVYRATCFFNYNNTLPG